MRVAHVLVGRGLQSSTLEALVTWTPRLLLPGGRAFLSAVQLCWRRTLFSFICFLLVKIFLLGIQFWVVSFFPELSLCHLSAACSVGHV